VSLLSLFSMQPAFLLSLLFIARLGVRVTAVPPCPICNLRLTTQREEGWRSNNIFYLTSITTQHLAPMVSPGFGSVWVEGSCIALLLSIQSHTPSMVSRGLKNVNKQTRHAPHNVLVDMHHIMFCILAKCCLKQLLVPCSLMAEV
jgi:hypothetical protein